MQKIREILNSYARDITQEAEAYLAGTRLYGRPEEGIDHEELYIEKKIITELGKYSLRQEYPPCNTTDTT